MQRKPAPQKSLDKSVGLMGMISFMVAALAVIPVIVGVLYAVAYMPFGVALLVVVGYLSRGRWAPSLKRRANEFLTIPEISSAPRERVEPIRPFQQRIAPPAKAEAPSTAAADLRNAR